MTTTNDRMPSEIELLLPWYAAGALNEREARQVEAALAGDPELAQRYEWVRAEFAQETSIGEALGEPPRDDVEALFARIDALPARRPAAARDFASRIADFFAALSPRTLAWSAAAAALAIVLQAGVIAGMMLKENTGYQTASAPSTAPGEGAFVLMRFQPQATAADIAGFLAANKLSIVDGPTGGQLYRVRVAPKKLSKAELTHIVGTLQTNKVVGFIAATD